MRGHPLFGRPHAAGRGSVHAPIPGWPHAAIPTMSGAVERAVDRAPPALEAVAHERRRVAPRRAVLPPGERAHGRPGGRGADADAVGLLAGDERVMALG